MRPRGDDTTAGILDVDHAVSLDAKRVDSSAVQPLAGHRLHRVPPELDNLHMSRGPRRHVPCLVGSQRLYLVGRSRTPEGFTFKRTEREAPLRGHCLRRASFGPGRLGKSTGQASVNSWVKSGQATRASGSTFSNCSSCGHSYPSATSYADLSQTRSAKQNHYLRPAAYGMVDARKMAPGSSIDGKMPHIRR
jgi:hypothetical protein